MLHSLGLALFTLWVLSLLRRLDAALDAALRPRPALAPLPPPAPALLAPPHPPEPPRGVDTSPRHTLNVRAWRQTEGSALWHV